MTDGRLQHIKELVRLGACDPHLDQTKFNDLLPLTIDGVLKVIIPKKLSILAKLQCMGETLVGCVNNLARAPSQLGGSQEARTDSALAKTSPGAFFLLLPPGCEGKIGRQNHIQVCLSDRQYAVELAMRFHADKRSHKR